MKIDGKQKGCYEIMSLSVLIMQEIIKLKAILEKIDTTLDALVLDRVILIAQGQRRL